MTTTATEQHIAIQQVLSAWQTHIRRVNDSIEKLSDEDWSKEFAPGRNTGIYLLGHLIASNESMITLFGLGEKKYPEYVQLFLSSPDKSGQEFPPIATLKANWQELNNRLAEGFAGFSTEEWLSKHTSVSEEDFKLNPQRNKLNVVINRTNHVAYHLGQLALL